MRDLRWLPMWCDTYLLCGYETSSLTQGLVITRKSICFDQVGADALHTLADGFRFGDAEVSHAPGMLHMRAATDLH